jgi:hypothetical protein
MKGKDSAPFDATGGEVSSSETIRIVLADDHAVVRSDLRMLLAELVGYAVERGLIKT